MLYWASGGRLALGFKASLEDVSLGGRVVVRRAELAVGPGEIALVMGPNGSGKTTLLTAIAGLAGRAKRASVVVDGRDVTGLPASERGFGVALQGSPLLPGRTALSHVALALEARGLPRREALLEAQRLLGLVGAAHVAGRRVEALSGGERARVALATAIAMGRNLLLDETFASIDPLGRVALYALIARLALGDGYSVLVTTHYPDQLVGLALRAYSLESGILGKAGPEWLAGWAPSVPYDCRLARELCDELGLTGRGVLRGDELAAEPGGPWLVAAIRGGYAAVIAGEWLVFARAPRGLSKGSTVSIERLGPH